MLTKDAGLPSAMMALNKDSLDLMKALRHFVWVSEELFSSRFFFNVSVRDENSDTFRNSNNFLIVFKVCPCDRVPVPGNGFYIGIPWY